jgi:hypothetical protein
MMMISLAILQIGPSNGQQNRPGRLRPWHDPASNPDAGF